MSAVPEPDADSEPPVFHDHNVALNLWYRVGPWEAHPGAGPGTGVEVHCLAVPGGSWVSYVHKADYHPHTPPSYVPTPPIFMPDMFVVYGAGHLHAPNYELIAKGTGHAWPPPPAPEPQPEPEPEPEPTPEELEEIVRDGAEKFAGVDPGLRKQALGMLRLAHDGFIVFGAPDMTSPLFPVRVLLVETRFVRGTGEPNHYTTTPAGDLYLDRLDRVKAKRNHD